MPCIADEERTGCVILMSKESNGIRVFDRFGMQYIVKCPIFCHPMFWKSKTFAYQKYLLLINSVRF